MRVHRKHPMVLAFAVMGIFALTTSSASADPQPIDFTHNVVDAPAPVTSAVFGTGPPVKTGTAICTTADADRRTTRTPTARRPRSVRTTRRRSRSTRPNANNMIGGVNDYQLGLNPGGHVSETVLSRAHVTFDGGKTWSMYPIYSNSAYQATGDPALAFDAAGHAYYGTLGFRFVGPANATNPDVLVSNSGDGGKTWNSRPGRSRQRDGDERR